ncbi:MAG: hypothetical protein RAK21_07740 [Synechococcus sp. SP2 MAG]|jgi:predicted RNA methylase|nr:hypothetical protein [Synechococcus sp. SP2 MAG]
MPEDNQQQPVVIKQGGGTGIGLVLAALILGGALVYAVTIWSNTQKRMIEAPKEAIQKGVDTLKKAIQPGS